jgi:hypothetical protein
MWKWHGRLGPASATAGSQRVVLLRTREFRGINCFELTCKAALHGFRRDLIWLSEGKPAATVASTMEVLMLKKRLLSLFFALAVVLSLAATALALPASTRRIQATGHQAGNTQAERKHHKKKHKHPRVIAVAAENCQH